MKHILAGLALGLSALAAPALAQKTDIVIGMQLEPPNLDPTAGAAAAIDEVVYANVFEGLTRFGPDGAILPGLAESWEIAPDGLSWVFNLREGVTFHDGLPLTAEDVVFSFDRAMAEDSTNAQKQLFAGINEVTAIDDTTVEIGLDAVNGSLLFNLAWGDAVIVSPASAETNATNPVGTGPFRFSDWVQGDRVELVRNDAYWGEAPALEKVTFKFISEPTAAFAAMMAGDVHAFPVFPAPENLAQFEADPRFSVIIGSTEGETILAMNNAREPFDKLAVRQAIAHAVDRQAIIDGAMFGYGMPIGSHFAPHHPAYVDLTGMSEHDPEKARALLAEAGYPDGFKTTLHLPPPSYARRGGEIVAAELRDIGDRGGDHQRRMGAVARTGVQGQGLRADHRQPHRADGHRDLRPRRLLLRDPRPGDAGADREPRHDVRPRGPQRDPARGAEAHRRAAGERLPLPARQDRRRRREDRGALGELADPGQRHDRGALDGVRGRNRRTGPTVRARTVGQVIDFAEMLGAELTVSKAFHAGARIARQRRVRDPSRPRSDGRGAPPPHGTERSERAYEQQAGGGKGDGRHSE